MSGQTIEEPRKRRGCGRPLKWGCGCMALLMVGLVAAPVLLLNRVPKSYPPLAAPMPPPVGQYSLGGGLDGFESPYLGHTGSWDGKGGAMFGKPKDKDMDAEAGMGLRWTFMPVHWQAMEPDSPVDLSKQVPAAWQELDGFVISAHKRRLNVLMQAPVIGGNAGGPPAWAGRREKGKSAPANMDAAAAFAQKLAERYAPGGTLANREGWGQHYGVRAWELDNEPNGYRTHWQDQAADYAEFVTKTAAAIRGVDKDAVIIGPAANIGPGSLSWIEFALDASAKRGSAEFRQRGQPYSMGPILDVVSFHVYEGLDTAFMGKDRTVEVVFGELRGVFERWQNRATGFTYPQKEEYWHTEGNFDFLGVLSKERRAAWRIQFLTRAFAAGVRKVMVMDASLPEQTAVRAYVRALPNPFPMQRAEDQARVVSGTAAVFCHPEGTNSEAGRVWVLWATAGTGDAQVELPILRTEARAVQVDGVEAILPSASRRVQVHLRGETKMAPPVLVIDRGPVP